MPETAPKLTRAEAARLNGGKSRGPRTPEGKQRSAQNAMKHGLAAQTFTLLPGEDADAYQSLLADLLHRYRPRDALAHHLVQRLASVMWRQARADRLEAEVLTTQEQRPDSSYLGGYVPSSPLTWDAARFSAVQRQQVRLDRALFRLMDELERLEPSPNEEQEGHQAPANDDENVQNEPEPVAAVVAPPAPWHPLSTDVLPLTPELQALLDEPGADEEAGRLFFSGRRQQIDDYLRATGRR